ncbi:hypothetical protein LguiA_027936 [Lonicera macranthoides]
MGRISTSSDVDQQYHEFQPESNPGTEEHLHQNQQQLVAFTPANPQTTAFTPGNTQLIAFTQENPQTTAFSPGSSSQPSDSSQPPQSAVQHQPPVGNGDWSTGLFGCLDNPLNVTICWQLPESLSVPTPKTQIHCVNAPKGRWRKALVTLIFPCVTYGQIAHIVDSGQSSCATNAVVYACILYFIGLPCIISCTARTKLRNQHGLNGSTTSDCVVHLLCESCALCQEYRELENRGLDPSIGWEENRARSKAVVLTPPMNQRMA